MQEILDDHENNSKISEIEIFKKIWFSPREVFKFINERNHNYNANILLIFNGIASAFDRTAIKYMSTEMPLWKILFLSVVLGGLLGWMMYYIFATITNWFGKFLNAEGDTKALVRVYAYAIIPSITALIIRFIIILVYGAEIYSSKTYPHDETSKAILGLGLTTDFMLSIWMLILLIIGTSEVQKLSIGKAILSSTMPALIFSIPVLLYFYFFK